MATALSLVFFWSTFFGVIAIQKMVGKKNDPVNLRIQELNVDDAHRITDLLVSKNETPSNNRLRQSLILAGLHKKRDLDNAVRLQKVCRILPFGLMLFLFLMGFPMLQIVFLGVALTIAFIVIPRFLIIRAIFKRRREIERHLPNALDLFILCLEAGLSFDSSLVRVAREQRRLSPHLSQEFELTNQEILAGESREQALKNLIWRTRVDDVKTVVGAILQSIKLGTSLVKTLRIQAEIMRKKRRERVRAAIMKTPVKLIFPLLFFIFPTLLIIILGPSLINIFRQLSMVGY